MCGINNKSLRNFEERKITPREVDCWMEGQGLDGREETEGPVR